MLPDDVNSMKVLIPESGLTKRVDVEVGNHAKKIKETREYLE